MLKDDGPTKRVATAAAAAAAAVPLRKLQKAAEGDSLHWFLSRYATSSATMTAVAAAATKTTTRTTAVAAAPRAGGGCSAKNAAAAVVVKRPNVLDLLLGRWQEKTKANTHAIPEEEEGESEEEESRGRLELDEEAFDRLSGPVPPAVSTAHPDDGTLPLHRAILDESTTGSWIQFLLDEGRRCGVGDNIPMGRFGGGGVFVKDRFGRTPFSLACQRLLQCATSLDLNYRPLPLNHDDQAINHWNVFLIVLRAATELIEVHRLIQAENKKSHSTDHTQLSHESLTHEQQDESTPPLALLSQSSFSSSSMSLSSRSNDRSHPPQDCTSATRIMEIYNQVRLQFFPVVHSVLDLRCHHVILWHAIQQYPQDLTTQDHRQRTPLSIALSTKNRPPPPHTLISWLVQTPDNARFITNFASMAQSLSSSYSFSEDASTISSSSLLSSSYSMDMLLPAPTTATTFSSSSSIITTTSSLCPATTTLEVPACIPNHNQELPLHQALNHRASYHWRTGLSSIAKAHPPALKQKDPNTGLLPFLIPNLRLNTNRKRSHKKAELYTVETTFQLLRLDPSVLQDYCRHGVHDRRACMKQMDVMGMSFRFNFSFRNEESSSSSSSTSCSLDDDDAAAAQ